MRSTHTYAIVHISPEAFKEIWITLTAAGYEHAFIKENDGMVFDMNGLAVQALVSAQTTTTST